MNRLKLSIPSNTLFRFQLPVRISDINYGNHLGNDSLVSILHEARVSWLRFHGFSELDAGGTGLIMKDLCVEYLAESFYGDVLEITISCGEMSTMGFELFYGVFNREGKSTIAKGKTTMICFNYQERKVQAIPPALLLILQGGIAD